MATLHLSTEIKIKRTMAQAKSSLGTSIWIWCACASAETGSSWCGRVLREGALDVDASNKFSAGCVKRARCGELCNDADLVDDTVDLMASATEAAVVDMYAHGRCIGRCVEAGAVSVQCALDMECGTFLLS